jgi:hypothetical protein
MFALPQYQRLTCVKSSNGAMASSSIAMRAHNINTIFILLQGFNGTESLVPGIQSRQTSRIRCKDGQAAAVTARTSDTTRQLAKMMKDFYGNSTVAIMSPKYHNGLQRYRGFHCDSGSQFPNGFQCDKVSLPSEVTSMQELMHIFHKYSSLQSFVTFHFCCSK